MSLGEEYIISDSSSPEENHNFEGKKCAETVRFLLNSLIGLGVVSEFLLSSLHPLLYLKNIIIKALLNGQVKSIYGFSDHVTNLKCVGPGLGEFQFDKMTLNRK